MRPSNAAHSTTQEGYFHARTNAIAKGGHLSNPADPNPGAGCVNPPVGGDFYPIFTTRASEGGCQWQLGGADLPGTKLTFGGSSASEYGPLLLLAYAPANGSGQPSLRYNNFRRVLANNPCPTSGEDD